MEWRELQSRKPLCLRDWHIMIRGRERLHTTNDTWKPCLISRTMINHLLQNCSWCVFDYIVSCRFPETRVCAVYPPLLCSYNHYNEEAVEKSPLVVRLSHFPSPFSLCLSPLSLHSWIPFSVATYPYWITVWRPLNGRLWGFVRQSPRRTSCDKLASP